MNDGYTDAALATKIKHLEAAVQAWAEQRGLWFDCGFKDYLTHVNGEPGSPAVVTILWAEGNLGRILDEDLDVDGERLADRLATLGYWCESHDRVTFYFYADDEDLNSAFESYFHWQWVCSLIQPDAGDVYEELYGHFGANPSDLHRINPRSFEILLCRIFQNQGLETELGPGSGDGGVDIRLWQRDPLGDLLTLVQVKRYAPRYKIELDAVAALRGVMAVEAAPRGLFVTTSSYLPSAKRFAERAGNVVELATSADVVRWCETAKNGIVKDKSTLVSRENVAKLLGQVAVAPDARVVRATWGYNATHNSFALVIKETKYAALLMSLPGLVVNHDGYGQQGTEVPSFGADALASHAEETVRRVKRLVDERGRVSYWDGRNLYVQWDRQPVHFNYMD